MPSDARFMVEQVLEDGTLGLRMWFRTQSVASDVADRLRRQGFNVELVTL